MKDLDQIYQYFSAGLSQEDRKDFEARLASDPVFSEQVSEYEIIFNGLKALRNEHFLKRLGDWQRAPSSDDDHEEIEMIRKLLTGSMSPKERSTFEERLRNERELREKVEAYRPILKGLKALQIDNFHSRVEAWSKELESDSQPPKNKIVKLYKKVLRYGIAASIALLVTFTGIEWYAENYYSTVALSNHFYQPRTPPGTLSSRENTLDPGFKAYKAKDFSRSIEFFHSIAPLHPRYAEAQLFLGYAYFESSQFTQAQRAFESVIATGDRRFVENAEWNLLLAHFRLDPGSQSFGTLLDSILANPRHSFHDEARQLRKATGSWWRIIANK